MAGDAGCALDLGFFYDEGIGVRQDIARARFWYRRAYRWGCVNAAINLGLLSKGTGDVAAARRWFRKASRFGDEDGALHLGKTYRDRDHTAARAIPYLQLAKNSKRIAVANREEAARLLAALPHAVRTGKSS